jgi:hypothetical protein
MQTPFAEWLTAKLAERQWKAADLTRASETPDFRGLDSGLISRWLSPLPHSAVPTHVETLQRLARALSVSEAEVWRAAGLSPPDVPASAVQTELETRLSRLGMTLSRYPRAVWLSIIEANERMAAAYASQAEPAVSAPPEGGVSAANTAQTGGSRRRRPRLPTSQHRPEVLAAYA